MTSSSTAAHWIEVIDALGASVAATDPTALGEAVPTCPGWTAADLIGHLGAVHRWAAARVTGNEGAVRSYEDLPVPETAEVIDWYAAGLAELTAALRARDPEQPAPCFVGERTVGWWCRRQAHELAVHRWDLDSAVRPGSQRPVDSGQATDAIDEWLEVFAPRFIARGGGVPEHLTGATLHLHSHDGANGEWFIELATDGLRWRREHAKADVALRGSASDLLLALCHRLPLAAVDVVGNETLAHDFRELIHVS